MTAIGDMTREQWALYRDDLKQKVRNIHIPSDVNPKSAIVILSKIDEIYSNLRLAYSDLESTKERIELTIKEVEKVGLVGKNEDERKRNSALEVQKISTEEGFTLYDMQRMTMDRYLAIKGILDVLMNKQGRLITINGLLKLDKDLLVSTDSFSIMAGK